LVQSLSLSASPEARARHYDDVSAALRSLLGGEDDWVAAMATTVCELHHAFDYFHWTGFYRAVAPELLVIGPYQGSHGCLRIPFSRGVCGAAARTRRTQLVDDVHAREDHIACSSTTRSEIVVPILRPDGRVVRGLGRRLQRSRGVHASRPGSAREDLRRAGRPLRLNPPRLEGSHQAKPYESDPPVLARRPGQGRRAAPSAEGTVPDAPA
jgi:L-methionine (R)-S-oxide reductase